MSEETAKERSEASLDEVVALCKRRGFIFPSSEIYRTLSVREDVLRGMLNCDQIGFQSYEYARHFLTCCRRVLGLKFRTCRQGFSAVEYQGRDVRVTVAHACVDARLVHLALAAPKTQRACAALVASLRLDGRVVIAGIDRLEALRGITQQDARL